VHFIEKVLGGCRVHDLIQSNERAYVVLASFSPVFTGLCLTDCRDIAPVRQCQCRFALFWDAYTPARNGHIVSTGNASILHDGWRLVYVLFDEAHLMIFNRGPEVSWKQKIRHGEVTHDGVVIQVWGRECRQARSRSWIWLSGLIWFMSMYQP
jgi:hypothetical protein